VLEKIAKANGYSSVDQLLMDYGFIPTVLIPKHKKVEIVKAIAKSFTNK
jgi:diketogulonate reductase-like aldo/keto reductase